eukprot:CAMPEP_0168471550 /NCGR_PEP_ID=MMETSP0228-20121227/59339_1 /TAXON_ID=133427 /ORGANISM="Protoceratium reticulatum, Strain CCCM 535 (=CCMP 1889)" /LENGTH=56 /DNA_ID=CAMNT_0008487461 /DNA_START=1 /DNA_END=168 /DNA_ORIENTATION=+
MAVFSKMAASGQGRKAAAIAACAGAAGSAAAPSWQGAFLAPTLGAGRVDLPGPGAR